MNQASENQAKTEPGPAGGRITRTATRGANPLPLGASRLAAGIAAAGGAAFLALVLLSGCGGGGKSGSGTAAPNANAPADFTGRVRFNVQWPAEQTTRHIPYAARRITVAVYDNKTNECLYGDAPACRAALRTFDAPNRPSDSGYVVPSPTPPPLPSLVPNSVHRGGSVSSLTVYSATDFTEMSGVKVNRESRTVVFNRDTPKKLVVNLTAEDIATVGSVPVVVTTPSTVEGGYPIVLPLSLEVYDSANTDAGIPVPIRRELRFEIKALAQKDSANFDTNTPVADGKAIIAPIQNPADAPNLPVTLTETVKRLKVFDGAKVVGDSNWTTPPPDAVISFEPTAPSANARALRVEAYDSVVEGQGSLVLLRRTASGDANTDLQWEVDDANAIKINQSVQSTGTTGNLTRATQIAKVHTLTVKYVGQATVRADVEVFIRQKALPLFETLPLARTRAINFNLGIVTATANSNIVTLTGYRVTAYDVGNRLQITNLPADGSHFKSGVYTIIVSDVNTNQWILDRDCTTDDGQPASNLQGNFEMTQSVSVAAGGTTDFLFHQGRFVTSLPNGNTYSAFEADTTNRFGAFGPLELTKVVAAQNLFYGMNTLGFAVTFRPGSGQNADTDKHIPSDPAGERYTTIAADGVSPLFYGLRRDGGVDKLYDNNQTSQPAIGGITSGVTALAVAGGVIFRATNDKLYKGDVELPMTFGSVGASFSETPPVGIKDIAAENGYLYVLDSAGKVHVFDFSGNWLYSMTARDQNKLIGAVNISARYIPAGKEGRVYVAYKDASVAGVLQYIRRDLD